MSEPLLFVTLNFPTFRGSLSLRRAPKYLRFTCRGHSSCSRNWDALDQLDDEPEPGEELIAAVLKSRGSIHLDRVVKGRRVGEWHETAEYEPCAKQPSQKVMRDRKSWHEWCLEQEAKKGEQTA